jgi:hypothetical protein
MRRATYAQHTGQHFCHGLFRLGFHEVEDRPVMWVNSGMLIEGGCDLGVEVFHPLIEGQDVGCEFGDDAGGDVLAAEHDLLRAGRGDGSGCQVCVASYPPCPQPAGQACHPDVAEPFGAGIAS